VGRSFRPWILVPANRSGACVRFGSAVTEEVFGPVVAVLPFSDEADALRLANNTEYGLSGSIWTRDVGRALRVSRAWRPGTCR